MAVHHELASEVIAVLALNSKSKLNWAWLVSTVVSITIVMVAENR